eukprot:TRINITY_DN8823_c0_g1_i1.p1 TRINITY_DN8823_c0_g1~~TRINITY_DN8823_c0_g1_i1.p1  ORF type:complete len:510 (-),score=102.12 TRINITY_DN8823_c0_g1_i1:413-1942(-)
MKELCKQSERHATVQTAIRKLKARLPRHTAPAHFLKWGAFRVFYLAFVLFAFREKSGVLANAPLAAVKMEYASEFQLACNGDYCELKQTCVEPPFVYRFFKNGTAPVEYTTHPTYGSYRSSYTVPLTRFATLETSYIAEFDYLAAVNTLIGVLGTDQVATPSVVDRIDSKLVTEIGVGEGWDITPNATLISELGIQAVLGSKYSLSRLNSIPNILLVCGTEEYHPLGYIEWAKWLGMALGKEEKAKEYYESIRDEYVKFRDLAASKKNKPTVAAGFSYAWDGKVYFSVPKGNSYSARLFADAGGLYIGDDTNDGGSFTIDKNEFIQESKGASLWINADYIDILYLDDIVKQEKDLLQMQSVKCQNVLLRDKQKNKNGYNAYFETGMANPAIALKDLIHVIHRDLLPNTYESIYYRRAQFYPTSEYKQEVDCPTFSDDDDELSAGAIAGIVVGCSVAIIGLAVGAFFYGKRKGRYEMLQPQPVAMGAMDGSAAEAGQGANTVVYSSQPAH